LPFCLEFVCSIAPALAVGDIPNLASLCDNFNKDVDGRLNGQTNQLEGRLPRSGLHGERIAKFMARAGAASRREAERLIAAGRVTINGEIVSHPATAVTQTDVIAIDGRVVPSPQSSRLWLYHKPAGLVTTTRDPQARPTVFASLPHSLPRVIAVGRLDINTEGLLLLTNDGMLARYLEHPAQELPRTYRVRVHGRIDQARLAQLTKGMELDGVRYRPAEVRLDLRRGSNSWLTVVVREGKNREIKRMLEHCGLLVTRLIRIGYGPFALGTLAVGKVCEVPPPRLFAMIPGYFANPGAKRI
jgi:23S rRNA pseudouridine2605 synthase